MDKSKTICRSPDPTAVNRHMHQLGWSPYARAIERERSTSKQILKKKTKSALHQTDLP